VDAAEPSWGFSICERTGVGSGVVYPVLLCCRSYGVTGRSDAPEGADLRVFASTMAGLQLMVDGF
jgi:hypothetical protein